MTPIEIIEDAKSTHVQWAEFLRQHGDGEYPATMSLDVEEGWIEKYDQVLLALSPLTPSSTPA